MLNRFHLLRLYFTQNFRLFILKFKQISSSLIHNSSLGEQPGSRLRSTKLDQQFVCAYLNYITAIKALNTISSLFHPKYLASFEVCYSLYLMVRTLMFMTLLSISDGPNLNVIGRNKLFLMFLYREAESYVSHNQTSKHQCTRLGSVPVFYFHTLTSRLPFSHF